MKGDPSRRLSNRYYGPFTNPEWYSLVQKHFAVLLALHTHLSETGNTTAVRFWPLEETTIPPNSVADAVLSGSVELCVSISTITTASYTSLTF